jgi:hypothetical protein
MLQGNSLVYFTMFLPKIKKIMCLLFSSPTFLLSYLFAYLNK